MNQSRYAPSDRMRRPTPSVLFRKSRSCATAANSRMSLLIRFGTCCIASFLRRANVANEPHSPARASGPRVSAPFACYAVRLCRALGRRGVRASLANVRSASLTARLSGNTSATSGSSSTTFVPCAYRAAVTPRTALEKSYSGRIVSTSAGFLALFVFIFPSFVLRRETSTDDSRPRWPFGVRHDHEP